MNLTYGIGDHLTLKSITGIRHALREGSSALSIATNAAGPIATEYVNSRSLSQELQALYSSGRFNLTVGAIYFRENVRDQRESFLMQNCISPFVPSLCTVGGGASRAPYILPASTFRDQTSRTVAYAGYAQASYTPAIFDERLEFTAGLRYSNDTKTGVRTVASGVLLAAPIVNQAKTDRFDPAFTVKLKLADDVSTYFRYATGFRDGGANVRSLFFNAFREETLEVFEFGLKSQFFDRHVTFNAAIFQNNLRGAQEGIQPNPATAPGVTDTINDPDKITTRGAEFELTLRPISRLSVGLSYTYLDSPLSIVGIDPATRRGFSANGTLNGLNQLIPDAATVAAHPDSNVYLFEQNGAPKHSGSVNVDYTIPLGVSSLALHIDWVRSGQAYTSQVRYVTQIAAGVVSPRNAYNAGVSSNRVNFRTTLADIPLGNVRGEVALWGKNVFNHVDAAYSFSSGNKATATQPTRSTVYLQPPATYGVDFRIKF